MDLNQYANAIASIESAGSGDYQAVGPATRKGNRAYGRYQVMDFNIGPWTEKYLGQRLTPEQFLANQSAQDAVFRGEFGNYIDRYGSPQDAASAWFTGKPLSEGAGRSDILGTTGAGYVQKFNAALGQPQGGNMQPQGLLGTVSTQGQEPEQLPFFQRPGTADLLDTLAIGFSGMSMRPNQALIQSAQERIKGRGQAAQTAQQRNATAAWLESQGLGQLADGVRSGAITGAEAMTLAKGTTQDPYSTIGKLQADLAAGRISQEQYQIALQSMAPSGMAIEVGADGQVRVTQGPGVQARPLTEGQSKDTVYATRAAGALPILDQYDVALTSLGDIVLGADPTGIVRGRMQSTEYQLARQAGDEFLQAILRKDTGAAITKQEQELYGKTYLPEQGDGPELIAQKRQARLRALKAIEAGLPPSAIVAKEQALQRSGTAAESPAAAAPSGGTTRLRFNPVTNEMEPVQ
jgi:hypothetical protein